MTTDNECSSPTYTALQQKIIDKDRSYYMNQTYNEIELMTEIIKGIVTHQEQLPYSVSELKERHNTIKSVNQILKELI